MGVESRHADIKPWHGVMERYRARNGKVRLGIVGQFLELHDAYQSLYETIFHASLECGVGVELIKIISSDLEKVENAGDMLGRCAPGGGVDGVLIPGDLGQRGIAGMVKATEWARTNKIPYFGNCLGMQIMLIEWARNVLNRKDADSIEFNPKTSYPVLVKFEEKSDVSNFRKGMRLGADEIVLHEGTRIYSAYGKKQIRERHRHLYEFNNQYRDEIANSGLAIAALTPAGSYVECIEWPEHPWGVGVQFQPEFQSKPTSPSSLFRDFIAAVKANR
jgi:CTP synthase